MTNEQLIFRPTIQGVMKAFDPFRVERDLAMALAGEPLAEVLKAAKSENCAEAYDATNRLCEAIQRTFGVQPIQADGTGCNEAVQMGLLTEFLNWKTAVKKNIVSPPTSAPPSPATSDAPPLPKKRTPFGCTTGA